jgi:Phage portal protein, SPP1 Gp6-like.
MTDKKFIEREITTWLTSDKREEQLLGNRYYIGEHDILTRQRMAIGDSGELIPVRNLPNNRIIDNQYAKMVDQKTNYLLGKPITFDSENANYQKLLQDIFGRRFKRTLRNIGEDSINGGISWLHPYYDDNGELKFKRFESHEVLPFWKDSEHTILDFAVRYFEIEAYEGTDKTKVEKVEIYTKDGVERYVWQNGLVEEVENPSDSYIHIADKPFNWERIPLIPFKQNSKEIPLIRRCKTLQDGINTMLSDFENNMQEDARNTILVIKDYGGENLGEFRKNLATYGAVKIETDEHGKGGIDTLTVEINTENYRSILEIFKKALIENAKGYDAKSERMSGNPNQMNIQSMYSDIDLDANGMETEYQASFEELLWFINVHLANNGKGDFSGENVEVIFNRDILINESEAIDNCRKSMGIISHETIVKQHPWINNSEEEINRLETERQKQIAEFDNYTGAFPQQVKLNE